MQGRSYLFEESKLKASTFKKLISLSEKEWKDFKIGDIFSISTGSLVPKEVLKKGKIARLTATDNNNGVFDFYEHIEHKNYRVISNFISVSFLGSVFYHPYSASLDMKIHAVQIPNIELNRYVAGFLVFCFKRMASVFSYGDQLSSSDLPKKKILLPTNEKGEPDFVYMENYMKTLENEKLKQYLDYKKLNTN
ncbi:MAG: restriction endonuclease subunit S [Bacteroidia bacterium]|nr:restriction endonuclease subunit S [Bacteroidia bacterium]